MGPIRGSKKVIPDRIEQIEQWFKDRNNEWASLEDIRKEFKLTVNALNNTLGSYRGIFERKFVGQSIRIRIHADHC